MKRLTIKDIAKLANVDPSTVSRALNNSDKISPAIRDKIQEIAKSLNFTLNTNAINFKNKYTKVISLIIPEIGMFFTPNLIKGITKVLNREGYRMTIYITENSYENEKNSINNSIVNNVDGILMSLTQETQDLNHLINARNLEIPIVLIDKSLEQNEFCEVLFDNFKDSQKCAEYLNQYKPKKILGVFGPEELKLTQDRLKGFSKIFGSNSHDIIYATSSEDAKEKSAKFDLDSYDSIYCMSDVVMIGLLSSYNLIKNKKARIVTFSDGNLPHLIAPNFTYLHHDGEEMGRIAIGKLLDIISSNSHTKETIYIESKIIG